MRSFTCSSCGQLVFFENSECLRCHRALGFAPEVLEVIALRPDDDHPDLLVPVGTTGATAARYRRCANQFLARCNWLVAVDDPATPVDPDEGLCRCCDLTRVRPNDGDDEALAAFADTEGAKRRLVFQLLDLGLPIEPYDEEAERGLTFDLMTSTDEEQVMIGHANGQITLNVDEADDVQRERVRRELGEPYRTMLGHLRHEIGHYYFTVLVGPEPGSDDVAGSIDPQLERCRALFGDESIDYGEALERHYREGPPADWPQRHVSAYATMHPAEDWAETFAHYLHIRDTLQTAASFGIVVTGPAIDVLPGEDEDLVAVPGLEVDDDPFLRILDDWLPLTYALNAVNRSMGKADLYPFVLGPTVIEKLTFVHEAVRAGRRRDEPAEAFTSR